MKSYTLKKISGTPNWDSIPALDIDVTYRKIADVQAWAQLCWNDNGIYVHLKAKEQNIRCQETDPMAEICCDSCLEFFFSPTEATHYFNFEYNPACALYLGYGTNIHDLIRLKLQDEKAMFTPEAYRTADGWGISYHIPFTFIQFFFPNFKAYEGLEFRANCYKCGDHTDHPHHLSWNRVELERVNFHTPQFFGRMILGGEEI